MNKTDSNITELLVRRMQGKLSEAEKTLVEDWLREKPENLTILQDYERIWMETGNTYPSFSPDVEVAWRKVKTKANLPQSPALSSEEKRYAGNWMWKVAASLLILVASAFFISRMLLSQTAEMVVLEAKNAVMKVKLPDGSEIWLKEHAKLQYIKDFRYDRNLFLDGEAFFEVKKDKNHPFTVNANYSKTTVLGTSFSIRSFKSDKEDQTTVFSGKVAFSALKGAESVLLLPGNTAICFKTGNIKRAEVKELNALSWKTNTLVFRNSPLKDVQKDLENYFGAKIRIAETLKRIKFTGTFSHPELEQVLKVISISTGSIVEETGDSTYFLKYSSE